MRAVSKLAVAALLVLCTQLGFSQQLRLGKDPYNVEKSAVLDLNSDNQGLLLPRIADTSLINALNPPDGMIIYFTPIKKLLIRANGHWKTLAVNDAVVTSVNGNTGALTMDTNYISNFYTKVRSLHTVSSPLTYNSGTGLIGITQANSSTNGYLSSADWNTFNGKANSFSTGNLTETGSAILTITGGTGSVVGSGTTIQVKQSNTSQSGFLSNTDWNTFNGKLSSVDTSNISNFYLKVRSNLSGGTGISYNNSTGVITNSGVISLNGNSGALTMDTSYISNFYQKVRGLFSGGSGISYNAGTGVISSPFNTGNFWNTSGNAGTNSSTNFIGTTDNQDLVFKTNNTETARIVASTGDIKIGNATTGTLRSTQELVLRQDGDTYGSSILRLRNRTAENGAIFETTDPSITLVDFIFKTAASQRNIRYEARSGYARAGTPSFHIGGASPDNPTLAVGDSYAAFNTNLKIGNYNTPTEALDVTGNVRFSGALMPNNNAGISGYVLQSNGSGTAPTWKNFTLANLNDISLSSPSNEQLLQYNGTSWVNTTPSYLTSIDTSNISNFYLKVRGLLSSTAPITYNTSTGAIGITQASTSTNGYLSSADWNTFNNKQAAGNFLTDPGGNGFVARTALNTTISRTVTGTTNRIVITNGNGASGNPTVDISSSYAGQNSINTLGTITTGTWNGNAIGIANGGTGQTTANGALNALLPSQPGNDGQILSTDGANASWTSPVTADNYVFAYSTDTKTFSSVGNWADITFNTAHPQLSGWSHSLTSNAQNFTCNQTGVYQVVYSGRVNNSGSGTRELDIRATLNGTEIPGSVSSAFASSPNPSITNNFLVSITSGQVLKFQLTGSNTNMQLTQGSYGSTNPSITLTIIRIK